MPAGSADELDLTRLRALARKKPRTKAGQVRQAWPEIRQLLAEGHSLKDVWAWLGELGITIPYTRLSEYVNQLRRADVDGMQSRNAVPITLPEMTAAPTQEFVATSQSQAKPPDKTDPLANIRRSEAKRPGFHYRPADPDDEKNLI